MCRAPSARQRFHSLLRRPGGVRRARSNGLRRGHTKGTHEKIVIVDGDVLWFGSLNPLSHTSRTGEVMARLVSSDLAQQMASFVAIKPSRPTETYVNLAMVKENPSCARCNGRTYYVPKARKGPYWRCEEQTCGWTESATARRRSKLDATDPPKCPVCELTMVPRSGRYSDFWGCTNYPTCNETVTPTRPRGGKPSDVKSPTSSHKLRANFA